VRTMWRVYWLACALGVLFCGCGASSTVKRSTATTSTGRPFTAEGLLLPARPPLLSIPPPPAVARADGSKLREFMLGRTVVAESGCLACHRIGAQGNSGPGPDLTRTGSTLSASQIERAIIHATAPMPSFARLPQAKLHSVVEFLALLR